MIASKTSSAGMLPLVFAAALLAGCIEAPPIPDMRNAVTASLPDGPVTVPFVFDDNRVFVRIDFREPGGRIRPALAFVNMGSGALVLSNALYRELGAGDGRALTLKIGTAAFTIDSNAVQPESEAQNFAIVIDPFAKPSRAADYAKGPGGLMAEMAAPMKVEAVIPPGLFQTIQVAFDYGAHTLTFAEPGAAKPDGVAMPVRINPRTGFVTLDLAIDGKVHAMVIDNGGSYSLLKPSVGDALLESHPDWLRSEGGIGEANMVMSGGFDVDNPVLKVPASSAGDIRLTELGFAESGGGSTLALLLGSFFWDWYSEKAGESVDGALGGNVLNRFRLTIDYPHRVSYWRAESPADAQDLDQVGITVERANGTTTIAGIAKRKGVETVSGVKAGDKLLKIDGRDASQMTRGALLTALHGAPGAMHKLTLERDGEEVIVDATVTRF
jgi:hypothetical protein